MIKKCINALLPAFFAVACAAVTPSNDSQIVEAQINSAATKSETPADDQIAAAEIDDAVFESDSVDSQIAEADVAEIEVIEADAAEIDITEI
jgi:hypothetical protein